MEIPIPRKHPELRLDPIEFLILLKLKSKSYELKELTESIKKDFEGTLELTNDEVFKRLENLRTNGFVSLEAKGLLSKKNYFLLTEKGENKLKEEIKYFEQDIKIFNKFYSVVLGLMNQNFPKMVEEIRKMMEYSVSSIQQTLNNLTKPVRDSIINVLSTLLKEK
ncbi:MAG: hypothetical protein J7L47_04070 [Candidatus Odinarchaeota archaeon]|nr:hypothetical protein [Candidatus Odinarchaeota archaeon]